jgi:hypothetical protein
MNDAVLRRLAGDSSYQRGMDYYSHGHVESSEDREGAIHVVVRGTQDYTVELSSDDGVLNYSCDCPQGSDGAFCKHCVAAGLAWLNRTADAREPHYKVFPEFKEASYAKRYEILLTKLVRERLYDAACFIVSSATDGPKGLYREPTPELSFENFLSPLLAKAMAIAKTQG